ncbi:hypothetical protein CONCODRAFT_10983 [Conidiobolus coronatus NRRL 28638]|uniref:Uncharacterized protein n=1 Tax=Conidiobolus coronatus (strain ATCC 28846 / CBS 209.66 / NRRL 28638) TaxID=796925 RepID=A0A137NWG5_CONC2|nr:hypothetical protein CONCODRAFT_10983 [Conidiobolus coronatus NRRL 28638]|eukprot:KXN67028.1 hypothetical protein CONCODRAFT_10983 [Conidiobolus coronatus NRRL 28638]
MLFITADGHQPCLPVCRLEKPECPPGQEPIGGPGCWGCCQPIWKLCLSICHLEKPECPPGEVQTGGPGCWSCCHLV